MLDPERIEGSLYKVGKLMVVRKLFESSINDKKLIDELLGRGFHAIFGPVNSYLGHNTPISNTLSSGGCALKACGNTIACKSPHFHLFVLVP